MAPLDDDVADVAGQLAQYLDVNDLAPLGSAGQTSMAPWQRSIFDGEKFPGGFGATQLWQIDYWTLRARSAQLFESNLYARGLIRRLVTNEINTGLVPESCPSPLILGMAEDSLDDWTDNVEDRFSLWARNRTVCDWKQLQTLWASQKDARREALVSGDCLVVERQKEGITTPMVQLVSGNKVRTPLLGDVKLKKGNRILHGVELDGDDRQVAFWIQQEKGGSKRLPARAPGTGRLMAWLVYGTDRRLDNVRGQPLLAIVLQSLLEIDRYRDSVQRKAVINSILAMFIQKDEDKPGSLPGRGGAVRKDSVTVTDSDGSTRERGLLGKMPGVFYEELQHGEKPVGFHNQGIDDKFGDFEAAVLRAIAWAHEVPPEILELSFNKSYAASQSAINEFKIYLNAVWAHFGENFCQPIWEEWLVSEVLAQKIEAPGFLEAWRGQPATADIYTAWVAADWYGSIKPSTDITKQVKGSQGLVDSAFSTHAREARGLTGTRWSRNVRKVGKENKLLVEAKRPLAEFKKEFGEDPAEPAASPAPPAGVAGVVEDFDKLEEVVAEILADQLDDQGVGVG